MTDDSVEQARAERIRRLQERRARGAAPSGKKRHAAEASRVLVAGLSVTSFMAIGAAVALGNRPTAPATTASAAGTTQIVVSKAAAPTAAQPVARQAKVVAVPAPHTTTHGS